MKIREYCVDSRDLFLWEGVKEKGSIYLGQSFFIFRFTDPSDPIF